MEGGGLQPAGIDVASEPLGTGFGDRPALWQSGRGRLALARATVNFAIMAGIAATLAWRGFAEARPGTPLYSPLFDFVAPLVFAGVALWLAGRALICFPLRLRRCACDEPGVGRPPRSCNDPPHYPMDGDCRCEGFPRPPFGPSASRSEAWKRLPHAALAILGGNYPRHLG